MCLFISQTDSDGAEVKESTDGEEQQDEEKKVGDEYIIKFSCSLKYEFHILNRFNCLRYLSLDLLASKHEWLT